jgi:hypothetical protein
VLQPTGSSFALESPCLAAPRAKPAALRRTCSGGQARSVGMHSHFIERAGEINIQVPPPALS